MAVSDWFVYGGSKRGHAADCCKQCWFEEMNAGRYFGWRPRLETKIDCGEQVCRVRKTAKRPLALAFVAVVAVSPQFSAQAKPPNLPGELAKSIYPIRLAAVALDDFKVVDCLLPGQIRRLGRSVTYVSRRQAIKTTPSDCEIRGGEYVAYDRANYKTALNVWLPLAKGGDAKAQTYVGEIYEKGLGTQPDYRRAAKWYRTAAEQGYSPAQQNLGQLYEKGQGVPKDPAKAVYWYRRAAGLPENVPLFSVPKSDPADELEQMREEIQEKKRELDSRQRRIRQLEQKLKESKRNTKSMQKNLRNERQKLNQQLGQVNRQLQAAGRPPLAIELLDPKLQKTRGDSIIRLRKGTARDVLFGRVRFASTVPDVFVNNAKQKVTPKGVFETPVVVPPSGLSVRITAVDMEKNRAELRFRLEPSQNPLKLKEENHFKGNVGRYVALVIGNNKYRYLPVLATAVADAKAISNILADRYGFTVKTLLNATRDDILKAISVLRKQLGENNNLLIYYAGHGELDSINDRGHWLPVDAQRDNRASWISNVDLSDNMNLIKAKNILVIADSCYSGALASSSIPNLPDQLRQDMKAELLRAIYAHRTRLVLTSGGLTPVLDSSGGRHSVFARALLDVLRANTNVLSGLNLYRKIYARVIFAASRQRLEQEPQYKPIRYAGHGGGDFIFMPHLN